MLKSKLLIKWTKNWKAYLKLFFKFLVCKKVKYILQKSIPKIKQSTIQLTISQLFQKLKNRSTNKQHLSLTMISCILFLFDGIRLMLLHTAFIRLSVCVDTSANAVRGPPFELDPFELDREANSSKWARNERMNMVVLSGSEPPDG
jgi:hypothetical protein